ncbi:argininosuccinate synthase domain-containing protein, partial [Paenibacillus odorifer]
MAKEKIVLAYSGGLDTSVILKWLKETYDAEIIAFTADIGQKEELDGLEEKALATGASKVYIDDLRDEFASDFIYPMFQSGALYEGQYLLGTSIARPLIAKRMVDIAIAEGATAIAHGATGKGNDQVRFELGVAALAPNIKVIAPWRLEEFRNQFPGRAEMIAYAEANDIPVQAELEFVKGDCVALNGESLSPLQVMEKLNDLGGKHGIGRVDMVENRFVGMKSRGVYETPGGTILFVAHRKMESITMDREVMNLRDSLITRYSTLVYNGFWFAPERIAL